MADLLGFEPRTSGLTARRFFHMSLRSSCVYPWQDLHLHPPGQSRIAYCWQTGAQPAREESTAMCRSTGKMQSVLVHVQRRASLRNLLSTREESNLYLPGFNRPLFLLSYRWNCAPGGICTRHPPAYKADALLVELPAHGGAPCLRCT